jgi:hypothetical protein
LPILKGEDLHYTIDARTGVVQFGPLIREPSQIQQQTFLRSRSYLPMGSNRSIAEEITDQDLNALERQFGAVPPRGSKIAWLPTARGAVKKGMCSEQA